MIIQRNISSEELLDAIRESNTELVKSCVSSNILPSEKEWKSGYKFLNLALAYKKYEIAGILLDKVTQVNNESERPERTPLHYAATDNKVEMVKRLLKKGADVNAIDEHDITPLHCAVILDNSESVEILLDNGASADEVTDHVFRFTPFQHACNSAKYQILESFLNHGCNVNEIFEHPDNLICPKKSSPLHIAITQKNLDSISMLLDRHADVNHANENRETSLHLACRENDEEIVRLLINKKAKINVRSKDNTTPLHIAVRNGNGKIVELLLTNGANTECQDKDGKIPLQLAVEERHTKIVDCLQARNHDVNNENNRRAFKKALLENGLKSEIFKCFLRHGFELSREEISEVSFTAVKKGYFHIVETLLDFTKSMNDIVLLEERNEAGDTLLHTATKCRQHDIVRLLISKKTDVQASNNDGNTPIFYAIENNDENIVKTFITEGKGAKNYPLLLHTVIQIKKDKSRRLLELILKNGADVNQRDEDLGGVTALHLICQEAMKCDVELADLLLRKGANVNATTNQGSTALHMAAARNDSVDIVKTLLRFDPDIDAKDLCGSTPLHLASARAHSKIVGILIDAGANINIEDNLGMTPVDVSFSLKKNVPLREPGQYVDEAALIFEAEVNEAAKLFQQHVVKLGVANLHLSENNRKYLTEDQKDFKLKCKKELYEIRNYSLNSYVSIHDVLMRNVRKVVRYTREENANINLEFVEYRRRYPIYGNLIDNMKKAVMREYVLNKAKDAINILTGYGLPDSCTENIFIYLRTNDLRNLSIATTIHADRSVKIN